MNGVNLNQFQFEYDLTWMAFFQDGAGRTYTRYGGREDHDSESHLTKASLVRVMRQVLALHKTNAVQPANRYEPIATSAQTPEGIPPMKKMLEGREISCIHCHDVKAARLRDHRERGTLEKEMVFTYPSPSRLGIHLDPDVQYKVRHVDEDSAAHDAGVRSGDLLRTIDGQRVLTFADATRVLEFAPNEGTVRFGVLQAGRHVVADVKLNSGWRNNDDPSWRSTTGNVGPMSGIWGRRVTDQERKQLEISSDKLAIQITYIWAPWAKSSGVKNGDVITSLDSYSADMTIRQLQSYLHLNRNWGDAITVSVIRGGKPKDLTFQFPDSPPN